MESVDALFTPGRIGRMETKNRLIMAPMVRNYADDQGCATPRYQAHIDRIARGGVGALILEAAYVRPDGKGFIHELGLHDDWVIPGLQMLTRTAHDRQAQVGIQLIHAGRQTASAITGLPPVAPSALPDPTVGELPHALTIEEIRQLVAAYAAAAGRAQAAGCDFIELHAAHGYLITQFLSPFSNMRDDAYGGPLEHRLRFLTDILAAVRGTVGDGFPVTVRLSGEEMVPLGLTLDDTVEIARRLEALGVDALHISAGNYASYNLGMMISPMAIPDGPLVPLAARVKEAVSIPVIAVNKLRAPELAGSVIREGKADFIALGRVLLADPDWPNKAREGRVAEINKCIACNQGCISRLFEQKDVWCTVNPETSREREYAVAPPSRKLRLCIAGGGPAGMEAAKVAVERGHQAVLFEESDTLGGQLIDAAAPPHRPGWEELRQYLINEMARLGVDVRMNAAATAEAVQQQGADAVIIATGSRPLRATIPGVEGPQVITARDLLEGRSQARGRVVIAGGGCAGAQTAEYLAERGHPVTIVEMLGAIAGDAPRADRELLLARLEALGVEIRMETRILRVEPNGVAVERPGALDAIPADTVVLCLGSAPDTALADVLRGTAMPFEVVGDAREPRRVTEAIVEGAASILQLESQSGSQRLSDAA